MMFEPLRFPNTRHRNQVDPLAGLMPLKRPEVKGIGGGGRGGGSGLMGPGPQAKRPHLDPPKAPLLPVGGGDRVSAATGPVASAPAPAPAPDGGLGGTAMLPRPVSGAVDENPTHLSGGAMPCSDAAPRAAGAVDCMSSLEDEGGREPSSQ